MGPCKSTDGIHETHKHVARFKSADELSDFISFFPAGTNSALSRCLTKEIW